MEQTNKGRTKRFGIAIAAIIIVFCVIGVVRRCEYHRSSRLVEDYRRPGGDTLAVAIQMSPLTYTFAHDTAAGFDYEILRDIAAAHNVPVSFNPISTLEEGYQDLYDGKYDLLVANMPATARLKEVFPLSDAVYVSRQVLVQRKDSSSDIVEQADLLRGDTVYIAEGSPFRSRLENLCAEVGDTIHVEVLPDMSSEHLAILTATSQIPRAVVSEAVARRIKANYPQLDISTPVSLSQFQVWAVAPGDSTLLDSINTWLGEFKNTPVYNRLCTKYLDPVPQYMFNSRRRK